MISVLTTFSSMAKALPMVKKMVSMLVENAPKIPKWVLTSFRDPAVTVEKETSDVEDLRKSLDSLTYRGGGDLKEQALKGSGLADMMHSVKILHFSNPSLIWSQYNNITIFIYLCRLSKRNLKTRSQNPSRTWDHLGKNAGARGHPGCYQCGLQAAGVGGIYQKERLEKECQDLFLLLSWLSRRLRGLAASLQTFVWRSDVQRLWPQQRDILQNCRLHGEDIFTIKITNTLVIVGLDMITRYQPKSWYSDCLRILSQVMHPCSNKTIKIHKDPPIGVTKSIRLQMVTLIGQIYLYLVESSKGHWFESFWLKLLLFIILHLWTKALSTLSTDLLRYSSANGCGPNVTKKEGLHLWYHIKKHVDLPNYKINLLWPHIS